MPSKEERDSSTTVYVVEVDTRNCGTSSMFQGYAERSCSMEDWEMKILNNPKVVGMPIPIGQMCDLDLKLYVASSKRKKGMGAYWKQGGEIACVRFLTMHPNFLADNNGAATFLTVDPENGLPDWKITGKAYIVQGDGTQVLTRGQVWGLQEMIHCAMNIYDMDPDNMRLGRQELETWAREYRMRSWEPMSSSGGIDIYGDNGLGL